MMNSTSAKKILKTSLTGTLNEQNIICDKIISFSDLETN